MRSFRRIFLDYYLNKYSNLINGKVIDIGGEKYNKRGKFNINNKNNNWIYINNNPSTNPDILSDASNIDIDSNIADTIIITETLEYIQNIDKTLLEIKRISKKNGYILISIPLFNSIHGDKEDDKVRYTESFLLKLFKNLDLEVLHFHRMGGLGSVIFDFIRFHLVLNKRGILLRILYLFYYFFSLLDIVFSSSKEYINTGYFAILKNNE